MAFTRIKSSSSKAKRSVLKKLVKGAKKVPTGGAAIKNVLGVRPPKGGVSGAIKFGMRRLSGRKGASPNPLGNGITGAGISLSALPSGDAITGGAGANLGTRGVF